MDWFWSLEALADVLLNLARRYPEVVVTISVIAVVVLCGEIGARIKPR